MLSATLLFVLSAMTPQTVATGAPLSGFYSQLEKALTKQRHITVFNKQNSFEQNISQLEQLDLEQIIEQERKRYSRNGWNWKEVEDAVNYASSQTGVRKEFLIGMLAVESDLGRNTGECSYEEVEEGARRSYERGMLSARSWNTFLQRREVIKELAVDLGYDYHELRVSCNPSNYVGTGGALGVPQFMPDTWLEYKTRIARIVGKDNPDPWDLRDGVVAMAVKLSDTPGVSRHSRIAERNAAKLYLSGTTSWRYDWYANQILYWAENYRRLIA